MKRSHHPHQTSGRCRACLFVAALTALLTVGSTTAAAAQDAIPFLPPSAEDMSVPPASVDPAAAVMSAAPRSSSPFPGVEGLEPQPAFGSIAGAPVTFGAPTPSEMRRRVDSATVVPRTESNPFAGQFGGQGRMIEQDQRHRLIDELGAIARERQAAFERVSGVEP